MLINLHCSYLIYGYELCPTTHRPHLQAYFVFKQSKRLAGLKKLHPTCKWIATNGTVEENRLYCSKEQSLAHGRVVELGDWTTVCGSAHSGGPNGGRLDLEAFKTVVRGGIVNLRTFMIKMHVSEEFLKNKDSVKATMRRAFPRRRLRRRGPGTSSSTPLMCTWVVRQEMILRGYKMSWRKSFRIFNVTQQGWHSSEDGPRAMQNAPKRRGSGVFTGVHQEHHSYLGCSSQKVRTNYLSD